MNNKAQFTRRSAFALAAGTMGTWGIGTARAQEAGAARARKGRIAQSVCRWCYPKIPLDTLCEHAKEMGLVGIDLLQPNEWDVVKKYGLACTMAYGIGSIPDGWNHLENHARLTEEAERRIPVVSRAGWNNIITFAGNRRGLSDAQGMENCAAGLKRIAKLAEDNRVTVCMELLNSKRDHKDYQCDHTAWGVEVCKRVGSPNVKLLYDIYHMQIMEGDVCQTIKENIAYLGHFHTGGVPGRREIDDTQELNYARICKTIADAGFKGVVAHEFLPARDPLASLHQAVQICDA